MEGSRGMAVGILTVLRTGRAGVRILAGEKISSLPQNIQTDSGTNPPYYSEDTGGRGDSSGVKRPGCAVTLELRLVQNLRIGTTVPPRPLYDLMSSTWTALPFLC